MSGKSESHCAKVIYMILCDIKLSAQAYYPRKVMALFAQQVLRMIHFILIQCSFITLCINVTSETVKCNPIFYE